MMAKDFIINFEGRLWTRGDDDSVYSALDTPSTEPFGTLLKDAVERNLRLISELADHISCSKTVIRYFSIAQDIPSTDPNSHSPVRKGSPSVPLSPQNYDDDLRIRGGIINLAYDKDTQTWNDPTLIIQWLCQVSLAIDESSVSILTAFLTIFGAKSCARIFPPGSRQRIRLKLSCQHCRITGSTNGIQICCLVSIWRYMTCF